MESPTEKKEASDEDEDVSYEEVEVTDSGSEEEGENGEEDEEEQEGKRVEWPPKGSAGEEGTSNNLVTVTVETRTTNIVEEEVQQKQEVEEVVVAPLEQQPAALFKPGKLPSNRWNSPAESPGLVNRSKRSELPRPKSKFRNVEEIFQSEKTNFHSYHVPPGTSRTKKAHEHYVRHLEDIKTLNSE